MKKFWVWLSIMIACMLNAALARDYPFTMGLVAGFVATNVALNWKED